MQWFISFLASALVFVSLAGCASITTGQNQTLSVETFPIKGAGCELRNDKGVWFVESTPGSVTLSRAYGDLLVGCKKDNYIGNITVNSATKGMMFGNILTGGIIGGAIDAGTGAGYDYPSVIKVKLEKTEGDNGETTAP